MKTRRFVMCALASLLLLGVVSEGGAAAGRRPDGPWSRQGAGNVAGPKAPSLTINPFRVLPGTRYQTGGTGLRNQLRGGITINGVMGAPVAALIYWAFITTGAPGAPQSSIRVKRLAPTISATVTVPGVVVGGGPTPCWGGGGDTITVFRAGIPLGIANGSGNYMVELLPGSGSSTAGQDPWTFFATPSAEGASMVIFYPGPGTTYVYDMGLSGMTFNANPGLTYGLAVPGAPAPGGLSLWDNIGADGQHTLGVPTSRTAVMSMANETTTINGLPVAGPGSPYNDSDWKGNDSNPIPSLWDTTGHEITAATPPGTALLTVTIGNGGLLPFDCLTPVANILLLA
jgi:hypothetical protein